jgi:hypothetical protein
LVLGYDLDLGKEGYGLAVHHRPVPLAHDLEIRGALAERGAGAPAVGFQEIGCRGEHVGHATSEIDASIAIIIHTIFDVRGGQKLRLADFAGVGTNQLAQGSPRWTICNAARSSP